MAPLIFGEVLFDEFPNGAQILGGAPFNVAWHLQAFGLTPLIISRIGNDELGDKIQQTMQQWQMSTLGIQTDPIHQTGRVIISQTDKSHSFEIPENQAFDFIAENEVPDNLASNELLYFGSLCLRNPIARQTLKSILKLPSKHFVDINLRSPWWSEEVLSLALQEAHWLKINDEELAILNESQKSVEASIETFYQRYPVDVLIVTCGENGAYIFDGEKLLYNKADKVNDIKDTVGAGDAFTSIILLGISKNWPMEICLQRALSFAADICGIQGATNNDKDFYNKHIQCWNN